MNRVFGAGLLISVLGLVGYGLGIASAYPGRAFSVTALLTGLSLAIMGRALASRGGEVA